MAKEKIKLSFEIDRFKVIGKLARNCETTEEYNEMLEILNGKDEVVTNPDCIDEDAEDGISESILRQLALANPNAKLVKRLIKEREEETDNENGLGKVLGAIEIKGDDTDKLVGIIKGLLNKNKDNKEE